MRTITPESNGVGFQLNSQPTFQSAFRVILFHLTPSVRLADVAVNVNTPQGYRLVSWFDVISESVSRSAASGV